MKNVMTGKFELLSNVVSTLASAVSGKFVLGFMAVILSTQSHAIQHLDLTNKENTQISNEYPDYELLRTISFSDHKSSESLFMIQKDKNTLDPDLYFVAAIRGDSVSGKRMFVSTETLCEASDSSLTETVVISTNGHAVDYSQSCSNGKVVVTPKGEHDLNVVIDQFQSASSVTFDIDGILVKFDTDGFANDWNSNVSNQI